MAGNPIRYINGWRLTVVGMKLSDNRFWHVVTGKKDGRTYCFSRHMREIDALYALEVIEPDHSPRAPL